MVPSPRHDPPCPEALGDARSGTRFLAALFIAGATLGLVSLLLPHHAGTDETAIGILIAGAFAIGGALLAWGRRARRPVALNSAVLAAGTGIITLGIHYTGAPDSVYALFYVWIGLDAFYLFARRHALAHVALVAAAYGGLMAAAGTDTAVERWVVTVGTVLVVGLLVAEMRRRVERLVTRLSASVERLAEAATTDALTELLNRRGFNAALDREIARADRTARPLALVLCDLDGFKQLNDTLGHPRGDAALARLAIELSASVRGTDTVARVGGEEFAVLMPDAGEPEARLAAERLRQVVERAFADDSVPLTMSSGVACFPAQRDAEGLMRAADTALYAAKGLGRNRVVCYRPHLTDLARAAPAADKAGPLGTVLALAEALDLRDTSTARHSRTVADHAETMARALGLDAAHAARLRLAGMLHDVGKIGVRDSILRKPGPLDEDEWIEMRRHPEVGAQLLRAIDAEIRSWVLAHHERFDGTGYPRAARGDEIPLEARILAVADAYEAMTADRAYRPAMPPSEARRELRACAGSQFDPAVVEAFLFALEQGGTPGPAGVAATWPAAPAPPALTPA